MFIRLVILIIILAFILRILFILQGAVSFHYDMSRDAFEAAQIWKEHHLKVLGPPTSTPGLYHGVFYYYLIAPFYALGNGDPRIVALALSLLSSLTVIPIMLLAKEFFKSIKLAAVSGLIFAVSFEATQYGPWLSDPGPAMLTIALFFYFLHLWQKRNIKGLYLAVLMAALSAQFEFFFIYLFLLIPIFKYLFKIRASIKQVLISILISIIGLSSFIIGTIKFKSAGLIFGGFASIFAGSQIDFRPSFSQQFLGYLDSIANLFISNFFPVNVFIGGIFALLVVYAIRKEKFIIFCLLSNMPIFIFGGHTNAYVNAGLIVPAILGVIHLMKRLDKKAFLFLLVLILISNIFATLRYSPLGQITLVIPKDMILKNQLALIDKTYEISKGNPFSINTVTLPLWTNTTWAYLYSWYGQKKYGYVPSFYGHDQVGLLGKSSLQKIDKPKDISFLIIEPQVGIPQNIANNEVGSEDSKTKLIKTFNYGQIILQYRKPQANEK